VLDGCGGALCVRACAFDGKAANLDPAAIAPALRDFVELHDAYLATGLGPDGSPLDPLEVEVPLATSAELIQTVDVALAEKAALGG
jgi:hypothetical protein